MTYVLNRVQHVKALKPISRKDPGFLYGPIFTWAHLCVDGQNFRSSQLRQIKHADV